MKKLSLLFVLFITIAIQHAIADDTAPFCISCNEPNLIADVYIVPPDAVAGQLISGQFNRIYALDKRVTVTQHEIDLFL